MPTYQAFNARLNNLSTAFCLIFNLLVQDKLLMGNQDFSADSIIDSFPVMLWQGKAGKCRTAQEIADFGYCSSKDLFYHGVKLHSSAIRRIKRLPLPFELFVSAASKHDLQAFKEQHPRVPTQNLFADKAFVDEELEFQSKSQGVTLLTPEALHKNKENRQFSSRNSSP